MSDLDFAWDPRKAAINLRKHGVSFEEPQTAFEDDLGLVIPDPDHSQDEERFVLLGLSRRVRLLVVVHCLRETRSTTRLISARRATRAEMRQHVARSR